jgi:hypothetical protein
MLQRPGSTIPAVSVVAGTSQGETWFSVSGVKS